MELTDISVVRSLMEKHGLRFQKKFGQNFLINRSVPERIAEASGAGGEDGVLEIGPGIGTLTKELCKRAKKVVSLEIDEGLIPVLGETLGEYDNFKVICEDVMKADLELIVKTEFAGCERVRVAANLPYYITTPVIMRLLESGIKFESLTFLIQKEVADRLCAAPGTPEYGSVTVAVDYYCDMEKKFNVPPGCFMPAPKVTSTVITLFPRKIRKYAPKDEKTFFKTVAGAFGMRRKTLVNALSAAFAVPKETVTRSLEECGTDPGVRGERLSTSDFVALSDALGNNIEK